MRRSWSARAASLAGGLALWLVGSVSVASATDVRFDSASYSISGTSVTMTMGNIKNYSTTGTSGTLRMELWAMSSKYAGSSSITGYQLGIYQISNSSLKPGYYFSSITQTVTGTTPPNGTYYVTMFLTEYVGGSLNNGFQSVDYLNFDNTLTYGPATPPAKTTGAFFGFSSASSVGGGYYYDSDIQYLYPFNSTSFYAYNLNRYYYINPGNDFTTGAYIYDFYYRSWTYAYRGYWPYIYYFNGTGWTGSGFR